MGTHFQTRGKRNLDFRTHAVTRGVNGRSRQSLYAHLSMLHKQFNSMKSDEVLREVRANYTTVIEKGASVCVCQTATWGVLVST
eukprot:2432611-Amphidinium_carterae.1